MPGESLALQILVLHDCTCPVWYSSADTLPIGQIPYYNVLHRNRFCLSANAINCEGFPFRNFEALHLIVKEIPRVISPEVHAGCFQSS